MYRDDALKISIVLIMFYGLIETYVFRLPYNFTLLLAYSALLYNGSEVEKKQNN